MELQPKELDIASGIDWLTVTTRDNKLGQRWMDIYDHYKEYGVVNPLIALGRETRWARYSYEGWGIDGIRVGKSKDLGWIVILSGDPSRKLWRMFEPSRGHVTRIDLATTVYLGIPLEGLARRYYKHVNSRWAKEVTRHRKYTLIKNNRGGETLYVGSRQSDQMGRIYDKGIEAKMDVEPGQVWRYEVEYKKPRAEQVMRALDAVRNQEAAKIAQTVYNWFAYRKCIPVFVGEGDAIKIEVETKITSDDRKLNWLRAQVAPTVDYLITCGRGDEAIDALGLRDVIQDNINRVIDKLAKV